MRYSIVAVAIALCGAFISATPITDTRVVSTIAENSNIAASFPVTQLSGFGGVHTNTTLPGRSVNRNLVRQEFPANLLLCATTICTNCDVFTTESQTEDVCFAAPLIFSSAAISQPSGQGLPFGVLVGTPGCAQTVQLPAVNECFNLNGPSVFDTFAFIP